MASKGNQFAAWLDISSDWMSATLVIPPNVEPDKRSVEHCIALFSEQSIELSPEIQERVQQACESADPTTETRALVAEGTPVRHGEDAHVEWALEQLKQQAEKERGDSGASQAASQAPVDFYNRSVFPTAKSGQVIGKLVKPVVGEEGRDLRGKSLAPRSPKDLTLKHDETIVIADSGDIVAQIDGLVIYNANNIKMIKQLDIQGAVDFHTGNINFDGDIVINKGVKDCFNVTATGNVEVRGLIEAASVSAGRDLISSGGMAGRGEGQVSAGRNLVARYIDGFKGEVIGNLEVEREVINSEFVIHGSVESPRGSIIGGRFVVRGALNIGALGSPFNVETVIVLASVPMFESKVEELAGIEDMITRKLEPLEMELKQFTTPGRRLSPFEKERLKELADEVKRLQSRRAQCEFAHQKYAARIGELRTVQVNISRKLCAGVIFIIGPQTYIVRNELEGPLFIERTRSGHVIMERGTGGNKGPLRNFTELRATAA